MVFEKIIFGKHLEAGEKVLFAVHRHWIALIKSIPAIGFFGLLMPWVLYVIGLNTAVFFWVAVTWSGIAYIAFMYELMRWYGYTLLITSVGILKIEWNGFFSNAATRLTYDDVEGASYEIKGFWGTVLRFGDFTLRTLGGMALTIGQASNPKAAEGKILEAQNSYLDQKNKRDTAGLKDLLSQIAAHQMRQK